MLYRGRQNCTAPTSSYSPTPSGSTTHTGIALLKYRDLVLRAARTVFVAFSDVVPQQKWRWTKIHNISLVRYMGKTVGGLRLLREELEAENSGMTIPAEIRWLSRAKAQARYQELRGGTSTVVAAVLGDATFSRVCKSGVRLFGRRYEVEAFEEARPDAFCNRCSRWGHVAPHCSAAPRCSICAEEHTTQDHRCPVEGCRAGRGRGCPHMTTRCANCRGPLGARVAACAAKKEARQLAWRWRSPPRQRKEKGADAPEAPEWRPRPPRGKRRWVRRRLR